MKRMITGHLVENEISYLDHARRSVSFGNYLIKTSIILYVHAMLPFVFKTKGSERIIKLSQKIKKD